MPATSSIPASLSVEQVGTDSVAQTILSSILASTVLDEISNIEDGAGIQVHLRRAGRVRDGVITKGLLFWLYPTGCVGPREEIKEDCERGKAGETVYHGALVTIEPGVLVDTAFQIINSGVPTKGSGM